MYVCIRYIVYFNNLWHKFEEIDSDHDRRINAEEFASGCSIIGLQLSPEEAAAEFKKCDADGGGPVYGPENGRKWRPNFVSLTSANFMKTGNIRESQTYQIWVQMLARQRPTPQNS